MQYGAPDDNAVDVSEESPHSVSEADLPAIYRAAGMMSATAQSEHLAVNRRVLALLLIGAGAAALSSAAEALPDALQPAFHQASSRELVRSVQTTLAIAASAAFAGGLWFSSSARTAKNAETWYDGRAIAESAKSMAWKYMMKVGPYESGLASQEADALFCADLARLLTDVRAHPLPSVSGNPQQITERMRSVRNMNTEERLSTYLSSRIADQQQWYSASSAKHEKASQWWLSVTVWINAVALVLSLVGIVWLAASTLLGVVTTAASCAIAWTQLRRHADLAHTYAFTSHEISLLLPRSRSVDSDDTLARFVADCETAFSREHTMWRARREISEQ